MDRLTATKVFVAVVDCGSLTRAAEYLGMTTAMVSRYLAALEAWLSIRLLYRTTRTLRLTEAGDAALQSARELLDDMDALEASVSGMHASPQGCLRIFCAHIFGEKKLAPALAAFHRRYPEIELVLEAADVPPQEAMRESLQDGFDVSFRITFSFDRAFNYQRVCSAPLVFCASPAYLRLHGQPARPEELAAHAFISHAEINLMKRDFLVDGMPCILPVRSCLTVDDMYVMLSAALSGLGVIAAPLFCVEEELAEGRLLRLLPQVESAPIDVYMRYAERRHQSRVLHLFIDFMCAYFGTSIAGQSGLPASSRRAEQPAWTDKMRQTRGFDG